MPELPEVETYIRELAPHLRERQILGAHVFWPRIIAAPDAAAFCQLLPGQIFQEFGRRGKYMLFGLSSGETLVVHLRMTGELRIRPAGFGRDKHTHLILDLDNDQELHYRDQRKFGRIWLVNDPGEVISKLGPEPLSNDFDEAYLSAVLARRKASIKAVLLDQSVVAGVGNIYADEALFLAGVDPRRSADSLDSQEVRRLQEAIRTVLAQGIELRGSSLQNYAPPSGVKGNFQEQHQVFRRTGEPCMRCGTPIERIKLVQRSTHFCPNCQR